jgi:transcriptional regulator with XRE-family HTH domain
MQYPLAMYPTNRLRELRKQAKLSQADLANLTGLTQSSISQFENDRMQMDVAHMRIFARELTTALRRANPVAKEVTPADLLGDQDNPGRLTPEEMALIQRFRAGTEVERGIFQRTAEAIVPYRGEDNDNNKVA